MPGGSAPCSTCCALTPESKFLATGITARHTWAARSPFQAQSETPESCPPLPGPSPVFRHTDELSPQDGPAPGSHKAAASAKATLLTLLLPEEVMEWMIGVRSSEWAGSQRNLCDVQVQVQVSTSACIRPVFAPLNLSGTTRTQRAQASCPNPRF